MHLWQLCHLAMVVPIADAYYESDDPEKVEKEWKIMRKTAERLKRNFNFLRKQKGKMCIRDRGMIKAFKIPITKREQQYEFSDFVKQVDKSKVTKQRDSHVS